MDRAVATLKALADRNRLRIVVALHGTDELCACQITGLLEVTGATVSRHLGVLERAGLVARRRDGRWVWYRLNTTARHDALLAWITSEVATDRQMLTDLEAIKKILAVDPAEYCRLQRGATNTACQPTETSR